MVGPFIQVGPEDGVAPLNRIPLLWTLSPGVKSPRTPEGSPEWMDFLRSSGRDNCADLLARVGAHVLDNEGNNRRTPRLQARWQEIIFAMLTGELRQPEGATRVPDIQEVLLLNSS